MKGPDRSDGGRRLKQLYAVLGDAEGLISGRWSGRASLDARIESVIARGWDAPTAGTRPEAPSDAISTDEHRDWGSPSEVETALSPAAARYQAMTTEERTERLEEISRAVLVCNACPLSMGRANAVPGEGPLDPLVMIIGEAPGYNEDREGRPFVGTAGQYLEKWLDAIGLVRGRNVWIGNVIKCRPPENRDPRPEETDACVPYLREQIALVRPRLIMTVGRISMRILTGTTQGITRVHGSFFRYEGVPLVPTFHPSAVLRNPDYRRPVWEDLKKIRNWLIDNAGHTPGDAPE